MIGLNSGPFSHVASPAEVERVWPAVRAARVFDSQATFEAFAEAEPWRVRVDRHGGAAVVDRWRAHLPILAVRGLWAPDRRVAAWVRELEPIASEHGFDAILSPLLPEQLLGAWLDAGMRLAEPIIALQGTPRTMVSAEPPEGISISQAIVADIAAVDRVDQACFDEFWRFSRPDLERLAAEERLAIATENGQVVGYTLCTVTRGAAVLSRLAVLPEYRRTGIARALIADSARYAERCGGVTFTLCTQESNTASRALYRAVGLQEVEERYGLALLEGIANR